jgi:hypothetical protein
MAYSTSIDCCVKPRAGMTIKKGRLHVIAMVRMRRPSPEKADETNAD